MYKKQKHETKSAFTVAASPFNAVKLELAIIILVGLVLWLVVDSITKNDLAQIMVLFLYGIGGAVWLVFRTRQVSHKVSHSNSSDM